LILPSPPLQQQQQQQQERKTFFWNFPPKILNQNKSFNTFSTAKSLFFSLSNNSNSNSNISHHPQQCILIR